MSDIDFNNLLKESREYNARSWSNHVAHATQPQPVKVFRTDRDEDGTFVAPDDPEEYEAVVKARAEARAKRMVKAEAEAEALAEFEGMSPLERADVPQARREVFESMIAQRNRGGL